MLKRRARRWANRPIILPGWMLTAKYLGFMLLGLTVYLATSPSLTETAGAWLSPVWGLLVIATGGFGAYGSLRERNEPVERWACAALAILLWVYAVSPVLIIITELDWDRATYSVTALLLSGLPIARAIYLLRRTGIKP